MYRLPYWILVYSVQVAILDSSLHVQVVILDSSLQCIQAAILDSSLQCTGGYIGFLFTVYRRPYWILVYSVQVAILDSSLQCTGGHIGLKFTMYRPVAIL